MQVKKTVILTTILFTFIVFLMNYQIFLKESPVFYKTVVNGNLCSLSNQSVYFKKLREIFSREKTNEKPSNKPLRFVENATLNHVRNEQLYEKLIKMEKAINETKTSVDSFRKLYLDSYQDILRTYKSIIEKTTLEEINKKNVHRMTLDKIKIRTDYKYHSPTEDDLSKLNTTKLKLLDQCTDPLAISATCEHDVFLLIVVASQPQNQDRRHFIRNTWAKSYMNDSKLISSRKKFQGKTFSPENTLRVVFAVGKSLEYGMQSVYEEAKKEKDIVFGNNIENYKNLTLKTRLSLKWGYYSCKSVYFMKADDDVFINTVPLVEWLKSKPMNNFYTGHCKINSPVIRKKSHKWFVSYEDYGGDTYPRYCSGGGYLLSYDVLGAALKLSYGRKYFPMEDLYVGLLINEMKTVKVRDERPKFIVQYYGINNICKMNDIFMAHRVIAKNMKNITDVSRKALQTCKHGQW